MAPHPQGPVAVSPKVGTARCFLPLPTPAGSHRLLLSWQLGIRVFSSGTGPERQRDEGMVGYPLAPFLENKGSRIPFQEDLGCKLGL